MVSVQSLFSQAGLVPKYLLGTYAAHLFPQPLARQGLFDPLLFAGLKVERMFLYVFDNVFLLNLALEASECAFKRLAFIQDNFRQSIHPPS